MTTNLEDDRELDSLLGVVDELNYVHIAIKAIADRLTLEQHWDSMSRDGMVGGISDEGTQLYMILRRLKELTDSAHELFKEGHVTKRKVPA